MMLHNSALITRKNGVAQDARGKPSKRQVTVLSAEAWENATEHFENTPPWQTRRANLLVEGWQFSQADIGKLICIHQAVLEITAECDPCYKMDKRLPGLQASLSTPFYGGVCCKVVQDGHIALADTVKIISPDEWGFTL